jgi:polar amino acid transport system substrate-binding protein
MKFMRDTIIKMFQYKVVVFVLGLSFVCVPRIYAEKHISICIDQNFWGPWSFAELEEPAGIHIEIARRALENLDYTVEMEAIPWKRCQVLNEHGNYDALVSLSYKDSRAEYLYYPADAATAKKSRWRVTQAEYVIVTHVESHYEWNGDDLTLPEPVRLPVGYGTVERLRAKNIEVQTSAGYKNLFAMLARDKTGVVIAPGLPAEAFVQSEEYAGVLKILPEPYTSRSYFMGISKKGRISEQEAQHIWDEIARIREDRTIMDAIVKKVDAQIEQCLSERARCGLDWD